MESTTGTTAAGSLPASPAPTGRPRRSRRLPVAAAFLVALGFLWFSFNVALPYYAIAPGSAVDTSALVSVDAEHAFPPKGRILLTTVSLEKVTLLDALEGWLDPAVDVVNERVIAPPDVNEDELRQLNLEAMAESKQKAVGVAFEALGFDAVTGSGAEIVDVEPGSPADGLLVSGDTIVGVDATPVRVDADAIRSIGGHRPGDRVTLSVEGAGGSRTFEVTLAARPDDARRGFLGVSLTTKDLAFDFPFEVEVQSERIGGPSAGLAFTLEVIDHLTDGELTGGHDVATTGTIELDGSVGEVGGVAQKTIAVRRSGAELFLVPSGELDEARRFAGSALRVEAVDTLEEALAALARIGGNGLALPRLGAERAS